MMLMLVLALPGQCPARKSLSNVAIDESTSRSSFSKLSRRRFTSESAAESRSQKYRLHERNVIFTRNRAGLLLEIYLQLFAACHRSSEQREATGDGTERRRTNRGNVSLVRHGNGIHGWKVRLVRRARARAGAGAMVKLSDKFVLARSALLSVRKTTGGSRR